ncbi:MAG: hypothetical protein OXN81_20220 [Alphaproteobacteria bacterium]|nr:hypothetical protein [Alphaproteobacteria bacterium]
MRIRHGAFCLAVVALAAASAGNAWGQSGPLNYSSHDAAFFTDLLSDRVWVYERPNSAQAADRGLVWGVHHAGDGSASACFHLGGTWQTGTGRWRVVPSARFRALYNYQETGTEPDPGHGEGHVPVFYDPDSGRLHSESLGAGSPDWPPGGPLSGPLNGWFVLSLGWVQESWPRALKDACPGLELPAGLPVNESQTAAAMEEAIAQDPDAALRALPGSSLRAPGSTGLGMAAGAATVTADELSGFLLANDGYVLESPAGARLVLALGPERDELWRLDAAGGVVDTALLLPTDGGAGIAVQWERLPRRQDYRVGDPFPLRPTGERHGAFLLTDRLAAAGSAVRLPFGDHGDVTVRFASDGTVTAGGAAADRSGRWWWSRGALHVALDGLAGTSAYPWRALAAREAGLPGEDAGDRNAPGEIE